MARAIARLDRKDEIAALASSGAWLRTTTAQGKRFAEQTSIDQQKYGFYYHVFDTPEASVHLLRDVRSTYPEAPIYIMSDGGFDFTVLCNELGNCEHLWAPPANDRWNPKPFFDRFVRATKRLNTKYVIMLEPDNEVRGKIRSEPSHDAGGIRDTNPPFSLQIQEYCLERGREATGNINFSMNWTRFGLAGGSFFRSAAVLDAFRPHRYDWQALRKIGGKRVWSSDVAMALALVMRGFAYAPWEEVTQLKSENKWGKPDFLPSFRHYGREEVKPFYTQRTKTWRGLAHKVTHVGNRTIKDVRCQGCVWVDDGVCWQQDPLGCPLRPHDSGPPEDFFRGN